MARIRIGVRTSFGEIEVSGRDTSEVLEVMKSLDPAFLAEVNDRVSTLLMKQENDDLKGIVEMGRDGPVIVTKKDLSHYESIGLILYCSRDHQANSREIKRRLAASGKDVTVPARLHEMRSRGHVFKPVEKAPIYKLSTKGVKWMEEEVLPQLKKK
jgi:hypothetical protein